MQRCALALATLLILALPSLAAGQNRAARIGWLSIGVAEIDASLIASFRAGMTVLGHVEGKTFSLEPRFALGRSDKLAELASALASSGVEVIVAAGDQAALAAKAATRSIPVVVHVADALGTGLVANLARPGGNITGVTDLHADLVPKRLQMLLELAPGISRIAFLSNPRNPTCAAQAGEVHVAAPPLGLTAWRVDVGRGEDIERAFAEIAQGRAGGLIVCGDRMLSTHRARIYMQAAKAKLPAMYSNRRFVDAGGLMAYGTNLSDVYRRLAVYVDRILKGAHAAELPIEQPTNFELAINRKAALAIGVSVPRALLLRADHVIQ